MCLTDTWTVERTNISTATVPVGAKRIFKDFTFLFYLFKDWRTPMNLAMIGSYHGTKPEINVRVEKEGEVIFLEYPYVFVNVSFSIRNSSIYSEMKTDNVYGLFMDCDFSSFSPTKTTDGQKETYTKEYESKVKEMWEKRHENEPQEIEERKKLRFDE